MYTTTLTVEESALFIDACKDLGAQPYLDYSGRGMYGAQCIGVVLPDELCSAQGYLLLGAKLAEHDLWQLIDGARADDFGRQRIVYFPGWVMDPDAEQEYRQLGTVTA